MTVQRLLLLQPYSTVNPNTSADCQQSQKSHRDLVLDEGRRSLNISFIPQMAHRTLASRAPRRRRHGRPRHAHGISRSAERLPVAARKVLDCRANERVAPGDTHLHAGGLRGAQRGHGVVHEHGALGIAREHDLTVGTVFEGVLHGGDHGCRAGAGGGFPGGEDEGFLVDSCRVGQVSRRVEALIKANSVLWP